MGQHSRPRSSSPTACSRNSPTRPTPRVDVPVCCWALSQRFNCSVLTENRLAGTPMKPDAPGATLQPPPAAISGTHALGHRRSRLAEQGVNVRRLTANQGGGWRGTVRKTGAGAAICTEADVRVRTAHRGRTVGRHRGRTLVPGAVQLCNAAGSMYSSDRR